MGIYALCPEPHLVLMSQDTFIDVLDISEAVKVAFMFVGQ